MDEDTEPMWFKVAKARYKDQLRQLAAQISVFLGDTTMTAPGSHWDSAVSYAEHILQEAGMEPYYDYD